MPDVGASRRTWCTACGRQRSTPASVNEGLSGGHGAEPGGRNRRYSMMRPGELPNGAPFIYYIRALRRWLLERRVELLYHHRCQRRAGGGRRQLRRAAAATLSSRARRADNDTDTDSGVSALTAVLDTRTAHASAFTLNADGSFTYTPHAGSRSGNELFFYYAKDVTPLSSRNVAATVTLTVNEAPERPVHRDHLAAQDAGAAGQRRACQLEAQRRAGELRSLAEHAAEDGERVQRCAPAGLDASPPRQRERRRRCTTRRLAQRGTAASDLCRAGTSSTGIPRQPGRSRS